jgi:hypothetical protein
MSGHSRPKLLALICILAAASTTSRAVAEDAALPGGCLTPGTVAIAGGASIVRVTGESLQHKNWQPAGGEIQFTVQSSVAIPPDAEVFVCFRWKSPENKFIGTRPSQLDLADEKKQLKITTTVPDLGPPPAGVARALWLVPLAEVRILATHNKETPADVTTHNKETPADVATHNKETLADVTTAIGIPYLSLAIIFAIATVALGFVIMHIAVGRRLKHPGILQANWLLRIISTPSGFASLSQLQILLWTFVVAASAVYVMSLSGHLIEITSTTLVLLGIAGAAGIGAAAHFEAQGATAEAAAAKAAADSAAAEIIAAEKAAAAAAAAAAAPPDPVAAARLAAENKSAQTERAAKAKIAKATRARADALKNPPPAQSPKWSDLIFNESVKDDGTVTREIDVARYQMLLFTLVTAVFVLMNVVTSYVIPDIPTGFVTLMGISNGVYMGSKIVQ